MDSRILPAPSSQGNSPDDSFEGWASHRQTRTSRRGSLEVPSHLVYVRPPANTDGGIYHRSTQSSYFGKSPEEMEAASSLALMATGGDGPIQGSVTSPPDDGVGRLQELRAQALEAYTAGPASPITGFTQANDGTEEQGVEGEPLSEAQFRHRARNGGVTFVGKEQPPVPGKARARYIFVPLNEPRIRMTNV